jgi:hypothetical protein
LRYIDDDYSADELLNLQIMGKKHSRRHAVVKYEPRKREGPK